MKGFLIVPSQEATGGGSLNDPLCGFLLPAHCRLIFYMAPYSSVSSVIASAFSENGRSGVFREFLCSTHIVQKSVFIFEIFT
jgi:hypothetical protein